MKAVDVIVVGQGIAGTFLSFELMEAGLSVMVIDKPCPGGASRVASGVINPVTGRRVVETWKIRELLPLALDSYQRISRKLQVPDVASVVEIISVHGSLQMRDGFQKRMDEGSPYIKNVPADTLSAAFNHPFGAHAVTPALLIDVNGLLTSYRQYLMNLGCLMEKEMNWNSLNLGNSRLGQYSAVSYRYSDNPQDILTAKWIIAAEGAQGAVNPYFKELPFRYNKGEALIVDIPGLSRANIYKLKYSIVPWESTRQDSSGNLFWVGSTYQWNFEDSLPSAAFKDSVTQFLKTELPGPFEVVEHISAVRPASINRRPFAGIHPDYPGIGILNGLGTKGCSLAPYLAKGWRDFLKAGKAFDPEVSLTSTRH